MSFGRVDSRDRASGLVRQVEITSSPLLCNRFEVILEATRRLSRDLLRDFTGRKSFSNSSDASKTLLRLEESVETVGRTTARNRKGAYELALPDGSQFQSKVNADRLDSWYTSDLSDYPKESNCYAPRATLPRPSLGREAFGKILRLHIWCSTPPLDSGSFSTAPLSRVGSTQGTILSDRVRATVEFRLEFSTHRLDGSWSDSTSVGQERDTNLLPWIRPLPGPFYPGRTGRTVSIVHGRPSVRWSRKCTRNRCK